MSKYSIYIICKDIEIFDEKVEMFKKYKSKICGIYWVPAVYLKSTTCNTSLTKKLNTRYNTSKNSKLKKLGCISAHRDALLSIINHDTNNSLILEQDATLDGNLPKIPKDTCYMGGWIIPPQITLAGKVKPKVKTKMNTLNDIDYDKFKVLMAHAYFLKNVKDAKDLLYSTLEPPSIKNYDVHLIDLQFIKKFYYPAVFVQSKHISDIDGRKNKNDVYTKNYGL